MRISIKIYIMIEYGLRVKKEKRRMTFDNDRREVHEGLGDDPNAKVLATHRGRESSYQKPAGQFYWHSMVEDVKENIKKYIFLKRLVQNYKVYQYQRGNEAS